MLYHILNRGVEKRNVFLTHADYVRFVHNLHDFNSVARTPLPYHERRRYAERLDLIRSEPLVDLCCWCLMPNHYHLFVRERVGGGASMFAKKISSGYTQSFNIKHNRSGVLFQGRSKIIPVKKDAHLIHLPYYVFANPIKLIEPRWKEKHIRNSKAALKFLENYPYSSYRDVLSSRQSKRVSARDEALPATDTRAFLDLFDISAKQFIEAFTSWLCESQEER